RDQWPLFRTEGADYMMKRITGFADFATAKGLPPVVCLYIHPWEFIECAKSYRFGEATVIPDGFIVKNTGKPALEQLELLILKLRKAGARFLTAKEIAGEYAGRKGKGDEAGK
ncbi:MAG: hypothetical protein LBL66_03790, partial [Clostridiales bacterium]|nr:hypothetical protein [Clostridiales bacterium]